YHPPAVQCAVDSIGIDQVDFGSDSPPVPIPLERAVDTVKQLKISDENKQKIFGGNTAKLLDLAG
ncbi:MAG TPA: amidohydrolase family protein, partial [Candidatus Binatia bacterium]